MYVDGDVEINDWNFVGDVFLENYNDKINRYAKNSFGYKVTMYFRNDKLIALILMNDIP